MVCEGAATKMFKEGLEPAVGTERPDKIGLQAEELGVGFFLDEDFERSWAGCRQSVPGADRLVVLGVNPGEVGFVAQDAVLLAMLETVNLEAQEAMQEGKDGVEIRRELGERRGDLLFAVEIVRSCGYLGLVLELGRGCRDRGRAERQGSRCGGGEKVSEDVGGDAVGVEAVGQDAAIGAAPLASADLVVGQGLCELEEGFPMVIPEGKTLG